MHSYGVAQVKKNPRFRVFGMSMTFTAIPVAAGFILFACVAGMMEF
jgi:uncharacterized membrane protein YecN with MAPEG domain